MSRLPFALVVAALVATPLAAQDSPFTNINPSWSPDGRRIVFESRRHGNTEIYVINADGTGGRRLTQSAATVQNTHPSWSPRGNQIVFDSNRNGVWSLFTIRPDGTGLRELTRGDSTRAQEFARHPEWSPDGRSIAFDSRRDGNGEFYVMRADGSGLRRVTNTPEVNESHPMWTPSGEVGRTQISPDGKLEIFRATVDSTSQLFVRPAGSTGAGIALTPRGFTSYEAAWSPDSRHIAFYHDATGVHELYVTNSDGSNVRQLTGTAARDR